MSAISVSSRIERWPESAIDSVGEFVDGVSRLDLSANYNLFENLTFNLNVTNILGSPFRNFRRFTPAGDVFPRDVRFEETIYSFGIRARM